MFNKNPVAWLLAVVLHKDCGFQHRNDGDGDKEASLTSADGASRHILWHALKARELHQALSQHPKCPHHSQSAVLDLLSPEVLEGCLVLAEVKRIELAERIHGANLAFLAEVADHLLLASYRALRSNEAQRHCACGRSSQSGLRSEAGLRLHARGAPKRCSLNLDLGDSRGHEGVCARRSKESGGQHALHGSHGARDLRESGLETRDVEGKLEPNGKVTTQQGRAPRFRPYHLMLQRRKRQHSVKTFLLIDL